MTSIDNAHPGTREPTGILRRIADSRAYDLAIRLSIALWSMFLAITYCRAFGLILAEAEISGLDGIAATRLLSKSCLFFFFILIAWITLVRARPVAKSDGVQPRATAMIGTYLLFGLIFLPLREDLGVATLAVSAALLIVGNALCVAILLRLGRSFSIMPEARKLVTTGPYAIIRHPLYCAEAIAMLGAFIQFASLPAAAMFGAQFLFQIQRMRNEEAVLERAFPDYAAYKARVARLIPGIW